MKHCTVQCKFNERYWNNWRTFLSASSPLKQKNGKKVGIRSPHTNPQNIKMSIRQAEIMLHRFYAQYANNPITKSISSYWIFKSGVMMLICTRASIFSLFEKRIVCRELCRVEMTRLNGAADLLRLRNEFFFLICILTFWCLLRHSFMKKIPSLYSVLQKKMQRRFVEHLFKICHFHHYLDCTLWKS
jgi:hypothetical protein